MMRDGPLGVGGWREVFLRARVVMAHARFAIDSWARRRERRAQGGNPRYSGALTFYSRGSLTRHIPALMESMHLAIGELIAANPWIVGDACR